MGGHRVGIGFASLALFSAIVSCPAAAETVEPAKSLSLDVQGHIAQRCSIGSAIGTNLGELSGARFAVASQMALDCNVPFNMSVRAINGAIANAVTPEGQGGYAGSLPYRLAIELPVRLPERELITREFDGRALVGGQSISSAGGIALDGLRLKLDVAGLSNNRQLLAGYYQEVIEITIAPS